MINFIITSPEKVSQQFLALGINSFENATQYVRKLAYSRVRSYLDVLPQKQGTCSTKHALLSKLAKENGDDVKLICGIFEMSADNSSGVKKTLNAYNIHSIPEAHCYLYINGQKYDFTKTEFPTKMNLDILVEKEISTENITTEKTYFHKEYLQYWLAKKSHLNLSFDQIWHIREECIAELSQHNLQH